MAFTGEGPIDCCVFIDNQRVLASVLAPYMKGLTINLFRHESTLTPMLFDEGFNTDEFMETSGSDVSQKVLHQVVSRVGNDHLIPTVFVSALKKYLPTHAVCIVNNICSNTYIPRVSVFLLNMVLNQLPKDRGGILNAILTSMNLTRETNTNPDKDLIEIALGEWILYHQRTGHFKQCNSEGFEVDALAEMAQVISKELSLPLVRVSVDVTRMLNKKLGPGLLIFPLTALHRDLDRCMFSHKDKFLITGNATGLCNLVAEWLLSCQRMNKIIESLDNTITRVLHGQMRLAKK